MNADDPPVKLSPAAALAVIREIAADSSRVVLVPHARKRGRQREISWRQIVRCCQKGTLQEGPFVNGHGHWQATLFAMQRERKSPAPSPSNGGRGCS